MVRYKELIGDEQAAERRIGAASAIQSERRLLINNQFLHAWKPFLSWYDNGEQKKYSQDLTDDVLIVVKTNKKIEKGTPTQPTAG
jgi:hypothetical protein